MDDIDLAYELDAEIGRLYKSAKSFSHRAPGQALSFLRGLAYRVCTVLGEVNEPLTGPLAERIKRLEGQGSASARMIKALRTLQKNGNKAAHPEQFGYEEHNLSYMTEESLASAIVLMEELYWRKHQGSPSYSVSPIQSTALWEMCAKAMLEDDVDAMFQAGTYFLESAGLDLDHNFGLSALHRSSTQSDMEQAIFWMRRAATRDHVQASYCYGRHLIQQPSGTADHLHGQHYIANAARAGNADALVHVGNSHLSGDGVFEKNDVLAREAFEEAALASHPEALAQLGAMIALGLGGFTDKESAATYTLEAARAGIPHAQFNLFVMYSTGNGMQRDAEKALSALQDAASQGFPDAIYNLATWIECGLVSGREMAEAEDEYLRAMNFAEYRARSSMYAAQWVERRSQNVSELLRTAELLQICYEETMDEDPHQLRELCLPACDRVITRARDQVKRLRPAGMELADLLTLCLFDEQCVPVARREERVKFIMDRFHELSRSGAMNELAEFMMKEACIGHPSRPSSRPIARIKPATARAVPRRNEVCHCGSGRKYKKCHGAPS